jgi:hypothetical protein
MNTAWLLTPAIRELGYPEWAGVVASLMTATERHGFREHYNPFTGRGLAARSFGLSTLLIDLLAQCGIDDGEPSGIGAMMRS